jgi:hypothetical protein
MVEFVDGATVAQLSEPDMRLPIGLALGAPDRFPEAFGAIDWTTLGTLTFEPPDRATFRCLTLAYEAGRAGGTAPAILSAANEVAVEAFLAERISWTAIAEIVEEVLSAGAGSADEVSDVLAADAAQRATAVVERRSRCERPVRGVSVRGRRAIVLTAAAAVLLLAYGLVFPTQVAIVGVVLTLPLIIMLHEAGHFFTAKRTGMKVTEFFIGFGPRIWSIKRGETEYGQAVILRRLLRITA